MPKLSCFRLDILEKNKSAVESSSLFHLCNLLIFCVLGDIALMGWEAFVRTGQIMCLVRGGGLLPRGVDLGPPVG